MQSMQARAGAPTGLGLAPRSPLLAAPRTMLQRPVPAMQQAPRLPQQPSQQQFAGSTLELSKARGSMEHSIKCRAEAVAAQGELQWMAQGLRSASPTCVHTEGRLMLCSQGRVARGTSARSYCSRSCSACGMAPTSCSTCK